MRRYVSLFIILALSLKPSANELNLPDLGGASGGIISSAQEYELGQQWQRSFRAQMRTSSDPFILNYTENLIRSLATYSELQDKRLDILVVENPALNAFAVPGGVIGVHTGLFRYAKTEQQFASVMAHELAHLSQRHFARSLGEQAENRLPNIAALLASILILATSGGDAGIAALSVTQAAALDKQLRFSRSMEQEADRIGMATMMRAEMSPAAMPEMFEQMLHASRFQRRPPEFLITHPLTESRVSDSKLRAQQYPPQKKPRPDLEYQLVKVRAELSIESNLARAIKSYKSELSLAPNRSIPVRYGLSLALFKSNRLNEALSETLTLNKEFPNNLFFSLLLAEIYTEKKLHIEANALLLPLLESHPNHHAVNIKSAELFMKMGKYKQCETLLEAHSQRRQKDDYIWYLLAEAYGLTGKILQVHTARAEYFSLNGIYEKAENHIRHALKLVDKNSHKASELNEKLKKTQRMKRESIL